MTSTTLPRLTDDLDVVLADLDQHGYGLVANALDEGEVAALRSRLVDQAAAEAAAGVGYHDTAGINQRLWMLVNKGQVFRDLLLRPLTRHMMEHVLGEGCLVSSLTANIAGPGGEAMGLHNDQGYVPPPYHYPLVANIMWMLDDFTDANGATRIVPGSHRRTDGTPPSEPTIPAEGPAGTALVFDGRIWHGTGANRTDQRRHGLLSYHCRPFMRQQENFFLGLSDEVRASAPDELLAVLGHRIWGRLGRVRDPIEGAIVRQGVDVIGELRMRKAVPETRAGDVDVAD